MFTGQGIVWPDQDAELFDIQEAAQPLQVHRLFCCTAIRQLLCQVAVCHCRYVDRDGELRPARAPSGQQINLFLPFAAQAAVG